MNLLAHAVVSYAIGVYFTDDPRLILLAVFFGLTLGKGGTFFKQCSLLLK